MGRILRNQVVLILFYWAPSRKTGEQKRDDHSQDEARARRAGH